MNVSELVNASVQQAAARLKYKLGIMIDTALSNINTTISNINTTVYTAISNTTDELIWRVDSPLLSRDSLNLSRVNLSITSHHLQLRNGRLQMTLLHRVRTCMTHLMLHLDWGGRVCCQSVLQHEGGREGGREG